MLLLARWKALLLNTTDVLALMETKVNSTRVPKIIKKIYFPNFIEVPAEGSLKEFDSFGETMSNFEREFLKTQQIYWLFNSR